MCYVCMQDGGKCRNAVNLAKCRFCDYHVQSEYARMKGTRGQLQDASIVGRMSMQARLAGVMPAAVHEIPCPAAGLGWVLMQASQ